MSAAVDGFVAAVMALVLSDVADGVVPASAADFGELHSYLDANEYLEQVGQVYDPDVPGSLAEIAAIEDEVSRRIRCGALVADLLEEHHAAARRVGVDELYGCADRRRQVTAAIAALAA